MTRRFGKLPLRFAKLDIGAPGFRLLIAIAAYCDRHGKGAWPSMQTLADDTGLLRNNIPREIQRLIDKGALRRTSGKNGKSSAYELVYDSEGIISQDDTSDAEVSSPRMTPETQRCHLPG
jgi:hypothetical protein